MTCAFLQAGWRLSRHLKVLADEVLVVNRIHLHVYVSKRLSQSQLAMTNSWLSTCPFTQQQQHAVNAT